METPHDGGYDKPNRNRMTTVKISVPRIRYIMSQKGPKKYHFKPPLYAMPKAINLVARPGS